MSQVELYENIRLARRDEVLSVRALATRFRVHRREVRAALSSPEPAPRKAVVRAAPLTGAWHGWIRAALSIGNADPAVVAVETRRAIEHDVEPEPAVGPVERVPDLSVYDQLLTIEHPDQKANPE